MNFELTTVLGDLDGPGYLEDNGGLSSIVRDSLGRFWVGQEEEVKIFDAHGSFERSLGREGQGPLEFQIAEPIHVDRNGRVHIFDPGNARESVVGQDFELRRELQLPGFVHAPVPLTEGHRYVMQMWRQTTDGIGLPLHIMDSTGVINSFGGAPREGIRITPFNSRRVLTSHSPGLVFSSPYYDYTIEVWDETGKRITGFQGPTLNEAEVLPGAWTFDNPPPNLIADLHVDNASRLWVLLWYRRTDWREGVVERVSRRGRLALHPVNDLLSSIYRSRVDVIDLSTSSLVASEWRDDILLKFLGGGFLSELHVSSEGIPRVRIWKVGVKSLGSPAPPRSF